MPFIRRLRKQLRELSSEIAEQKAVVHEFVAMSLEIKEKPPDTFLGRKTQEPFPQEDEEHTARSMASKELKPPE